MKKRFISIGWRISTLILVISLFSTAAIIALLYFTSLNGEYERVAEYQREIKESHVPTMTATLWNYEFQQLAKQMDGLLSGRHVVYLQIRHLGGLLEVGEASAAAIEASYPLKYHETEYLGDLTIHFSEKSIRHAASEQLRTLFLPIAVQLLFITVLVVLVYHISITRHLRQICLYTSKLTTENLHQRFAFQRGPTRWSEDEFDQLLSAIDAMRLNLIEQLAQRQEMEKLLLRNKKMEALGTLAGGVAHDLNNILTGIVSYPELLMQQIGKEHSLHSSLQRIQESGLRAAAIVQDLLTLARRGALPLEVIEFDHTVAAYLNSPEFLTLKAANPEKRFIIQLGAANRCIRGSRVQINKALMNLVTNAVEAIAEQGTIIISTTTASRDMENSLPATLKGRYCLVLNVEDNGVGIPEKEIERIFEPFYSKKILGKNGSGLGMTVVYGAVQDHEGDIQVSSSPDQGTKISLYFPLVEEQPEPLPVKDEKDYQGRGELVLIVDDDADQRQIASQILSSLGYQSQAVESGEAALAFLGRHRVALIVLDMIMDPGLDGLETFRRLRRLNAEQRVIIVSGYAESFRVKHALAEGALGYLQKPYVMGDLAKAVHGALYSSAHCSVQSLAEP